jgi:hypothetical protein
MVVIDTHLARRASSGGVTFHDRGGPCGRTNGARRVVAVDVTELPVGASLVPASTHENRASELMLEHLTSRGVAARLELVLVDRGSTLLPLAPSAGSTTSSCAESDTDSPAPTSGRSVSKPRNAASCMCRRYHFGIICSWL